GPVAALQCVQQLLLWWTPGLHDRRRHRNADDDHRRRGRPDAYFADFDAIGDTGRLSVARPQRDSIFTRPRARRLSLGPGSSQPQKVRLAPDSTLEGTGFEPVWGFSCQVMFLVCCRLFVRSGKAVPRPVACDQVRGARGEALVNAAAIALTPRR